MKAKKIIYERFLLLALRRITVYDDKNHLLFDSEHNESSEIIFDKNHGRPNWLQIELDYDVGTAYALTSG